MACCKSKCSADKKAEEKKEAPKKSGCCKKSK